MTRLRACLLLLALSALCPLGADPAPRRSDALTSQPTPVKAEAPASPMSQATFSGLRLRLIGPAVCSGRVTSLAVHPTDRSHFYVGAASGGVWKTTNAGTTWTPVFDEQGAYSIGYVALDPRNPHVVWVGTGENNSQRSVGYGDGVYRSDDGGKSWKNVGLKRSEHIGKILLDPRDSSVVYVAAQGPLWGPGGDRGLYKTLDGGKTWRKVLEISENTGVTDVVLHPKKPDTLIAASYQRRRHVWTLINGGPESGLHKSTDGGKTWKKLTSGLPTVEMGRIGLAVAPSEPDTVYAIVEAAQGKGGLYRSTDFGETWERRNEFDQQAQYYAHVVVDPVNRDRVYIMNVFIKVSDDGGKTLSNLPMRAMHVDCHCLWIDPRDPKFYMVGCDGGVYISHDRAANWRFVENLPLAQFYDVTADENAPFYHVYGGTQDNNTMGGPARTRSSHGITNADWFVTRTGDGFHCKVDPKDPNIVYSESQYGGLSRYDRRTGQKVGIQPQPGKGEPPLRWNWDSPLVLSPHSNTRLYFAANRVFRSDDRGDSWTAISPDLTRQLDRDRLPVMGKVWPADAVAKHLSTSFYGNITALAESPKQEGLLFAGTDDGLIQVTEDGGKNWRKIDRFPGVPERTYVARLCASQHEAKTVYAAFDAHKNSDYRPYLLKSTDAGKTWKSIAGNLPEHGTVLAIAEDHKNPELLFVGTEFGLFFTNDGGRNWVRLKGGFPTIAVRDLAIQKQMDDLVVGTFGRGIYILDDYSPLRTASVQTLQKEATLFPARDALLYIQTQQYGLGGKAFLGETFYTAENPPFGATFTYHLREGLKTQKQRRLDAEKEAEKKGQPLPYPSRDQLRAEAEEEPPAILLTISDAEGQIVRQISGPTTSGLHRISWDLRYPAATLPREPRPEDMFSGAPAGPLALPGTYTARLSKRVQGRVTPLGEAVTFKVVLPPSDRVSDADLRALGEFNKRLQRLDRSASAALASANELATRLETIRRALDHAPAVETRWKTAVRQMIARNRELLRALRGDVVLQARNENTPVSILDRVRYASSSQRSSLARPTRTAEEACRIASEELSEVVKKLRALVEVDLKALEKALDDAGVPWTPGRLPTEKP